MTATALKLFILWEVADMISKSLLDAVLCERHGTAAQEKFSHAAVGIAGLGGLGSNIAVHLARLGVGHLILADFDKVELSNLNRQHYFLRHLGQWKTEALKEQLLEINPYLTCQLHTTHITPHNACTLFDRCDVICEAFDRADQKAMLIETLLAGLPDIPLISGSGMAGTHSANDIHTLHRFQNLYLCGDQTSDIADGQCLMAPRVAVCAAHEAAMVMRLLLGEKES